MTTGSSAPVRYVFLLLLALLALASCAREPQRPLMSPLESGTPWWDNYGYRETELSGNRFEVVYLSRQEGVPAYWKLDEKLEQRLVERGGDFAQWRAAELCLEKRYPAFKISDERIDVTKKIIGRDPELGPNNSTTYLFRPMNFLSYASIWLQPRAVLKIELLEDASADSPDIFDARETAARFAEKYPHARDPVAPVIPIP